MRIDNFKFGELRKSELEVKINLKPANNINILGKFCGIRDINELNQEKLLEYYGIRQADVMVLYNISSGFIAREKYRI